MAKSARKPAAHITFTLQEDGTVKVTQKDSHKIFAAIANEKGLSAFLTNRPIIEGSSGAEQFLFDAIFGVNRKSLSTRDASVNPGDEGE
jgi:hypothetical protein